MYFFVLSITGAEGLLQGLKTSDFHAVKQIKCVHPDYSLATELHNTVERPLLHGSWQNFQPKWLSYLTAVKEAIPESGVVQKFIWPPRGLEFAETTENR